MLKIFIRVAMVLCLYIVTIQTEALAQNKSATLEPQLNISVLLDLSDRIDPKLVTYMPTQNERDVEIIRLLADLMKEDMEKRGAYNAKGKIRVLFSPPPNDPEINSIAQKMSVDLSNMTPKEKKHIYDNISKDFEENTKKIYDLSISKAKWDGSDLWRFFKNNVKDYCIESDDSYRNILIILTDGYVYHKNSVNVVNNRSTYVLPKLFGKYGLRNNPQWETIFDKKDLGLISTRDDLQNLEVMVLEVNPSAKNRDDEDIIKKYLSKWFEEMGVSKYKIYNTDLPQYTQKRVKEFL